MFQIIQVLLQVLCIVYDESHGTCYSYDIGCNGDGRGLLSGGRGERGGDSHLGAACLIHHVWYKDLRGRERRWNFHGLNEG